MIIITRKQSCNCCLSRSFKTESVFWILRIKLNRGLTFVLFSWKGFIKMVIGRLSIVALSTILTCIGGMYITLHAKLVHAYGSKLCSQSRNWHALMIRMVVNQLLSLIIKKRHWRTPFQIYFILLSGVELV